MMWRRITKHWQLLEMTAYGSCLTGRWRTHYAAAKKYKWRLRFTAYFYERFHSYLRHIQQSRTSTSNCPLVHGRRGVDEESDDRHVWGVQRKKLKLSHTKTRWMYMHKTNYAFFFPLTFFYLSRKGLQVPQQATGFPITRSSLLLSHRSRHDCKRRIANTTSNISKWTTITEMNIRKAD